MISNFEELQKIKDKELEILKEFDRVCKIFSCKYTFPRELAGRGTP